MLGAAYVRTVPKSREMSPQLPPIRAQKTHEANERAGLHLKNVFGNRPVHGEFLNAAKLKGLRILLGLPEWAISCSFWRI